MKHQCQRGDEAEALGPTNCDTCTCTYITRNKFRMYLRHKFSQKVLFQHLWDLAEIVDDCVLGSHRPTSHLIKTDSN